MYKYSFLRTKVSENIRDGKKGSHGHSELRNWIQCDTWAIQNGKSAWINFMLGLDKIQTVFVLFKGQITAVFGENQFIIHSVSLTTSHSVNGEKQYYATLPQFHWMPNPMWITSLSYRTMCIDWLHSDSCFLISPFKFTWHTEIPNPNTISLRAFVC